MSTQAVVFDLDGTLINSLGDIAGSANWALGQLGLPKHDVEAYRYFIGNGADVLMERALGDAAAELGAKGLELFLGHYAEHSMDVTRVYAGVGALLDAVSRRGLPMAILTNKPQAATEDVVKTLLGRWKWSVVWGHREGIAKKPDPAGALGIATELNVAAKDCVFVGDSAPDMLTAKGAGMMAVGVLWGFRERAELLENGADHLIEKPAELVKLL